MATCSWAVASDGSWSIAANWLVGGAPAPSPPGTLDLAIIAQPGSYTVSSAGTVTVAGLQIVDPAATLFDGGAFTASGTLANAGSITLASGATLSVAQLSNTGSIALGTGYLAISGTISTGQLGAISGGCVWFSQGASLDNTGAVLTVGTSGGIGALVVTGATLNGGTLLSLGGQTTLEASGFGPGGSRDAVLSGVVLAGSFTMTSGSSDASVVLQNATIQAVGLSQMSALTVSGGGDSTAWPGLTIAGTATVDDTVINIDGKISAAGTLVLGANTSVTITTSPDTRSGITGTGMVSSAGTIVAVDGLLAIGAGNFVNTGTITHHPLTWNYATTDQGTLELDGTSFSNAGLIVNAGYSYAPGIADFTAQTLTNTGTIVSNAVGTVILEPGSGITLNNGLIEAAGGNVVVRSDLTGSGILTVSQGSTAELGGLYAGDNFAFTDATGLLKFDLPGGTADVTGFAPGDIIALMGVNATVQTTGTLVTAMSGGKVIASFVMPDLPVGSHVKANPDGAGNTLLTLPARPFDFAASGTSDILFRDLASGNFSDFLMNNGQPTFATVGIADPHLRATGVGDFNGDGTADILLRDPAGGALSQFVMKNNQPTWATIGWADPALQVAGVGDLNGDGTADILLRDPTSGGLSDFLMNKGQPTFATIGIADPRLQVAGVGDFNGDGTSDILLRDPTSGRLSMFAMTDNHPTFAYVGFADPVLKVVGIGDFNGDGTDDILFRDPNGGSLSDFLMTNGTPTWSAIGWADPGQQVSGTGDYNGDGTADILFREPTGGGIGMFAMHNNQPTWTPIGWAAPNLSIAG